jgi:hypothetical protein
VRQGSTSPAGCQGGEAVIPRDAHRGGPSPGARPRPPIPVARRTSSSSAVAGVRGAATAAHDCHVNGIECPGVHRRREAGPYGPPLRMHRFC